MLGNSQDPVGCVDEALSWFKDAVWRQFASAELVKRLFGIVDELPSESDQLLRSVHFAERFHIVERWHGVALLFKEGDRGRTMARSLRPSVGRALLGP
jgi:hypothetical protein